MSDNDNTPTDFDQLYPGRFIKSGDVLKPTDVTIGAVHMDSLRSDTGGLKFKAILAFSHAPTKAKEMVLNKTNGFCVLGMFGRDPRAWVGKRLTLQAANVQFGPKKTMGVRVIGSPDLEKPVQVEIKLPQKSVQTVTMQATGERPAKKQHPAVTATTEALGAKVKRAGTSDLSDEQKHNVATRRERFAALIGEKDPERAKQIAREQLGTVGASTYAAWIVRADAKIAALTPMEPSGDDAPDGDEPTND
jgi:hypothetical protein